MYHVMRDKSLDLIFMMTCGCLGQCWHWVLRVLVKWLIRC